MKEKEKDETKGQQEGRAANEETDKKAEEGTAEQARAPWKLLTRSNEDADDERRIVDASSHCGSKKWNK